MAKEPRAPWMKWYPADWRQEPSLRLCSRAARSLWMDMLGLMHEADPYGHLLVNGKPIDPRQLAAVLGDSEKDVKRLLAELEDAGVFSRADNGTIISRRMLRDKARDEANRANGRHGGNPKLRRSVNQEATGGLTQNEDEVNPEDKAQRPEARSQKPEKEKYAFRGSVVRLTEPDFERWKATYAAIPDLSAELTRIDASFAAKAPDNWFVAASAMLNAKHQKNLEAQKSGRPRASSDGYVPMGNSG